MMLCRFISLLLLAFAPITVARCEDATNTAATNRQYFQVKGVVKELKPDGKTIVIAHEEVPHYMPAMTMPFEARDTNELRGLQPGDRIGFQLVVTPDNGWIEHIVKLTPQRAMNLPSRPSFQLVRDVDPLKVGDPLPDYHFTNELGQVVSTKQLKGEAFAFTFFFTRCPFPNFCPLMSANFEQTQQKLLAMPNAPTNWHLFSISFDPDYDSPATLLHYAKRFDYDPKHWSFVTGDIIDLNAIGDQFGEFFGHDENGGVSHNLRTVVIDTQGRVAKIIPDNKWNSDELVAELIKAAKVKDSGDHQK